MTSLNALTLEVITARAEDEQIAPVNFKQVKLTKRAGLSEPDHA